ncbi:MAG: ABC-2 family transporter protein [Sedimentisphaerales bacterium]|nr:ABC-2 family transporter protein [Sedimentisphaerales bacterium]
MRIGLTVFAVVSSARMFIGLFVLQATVTFWTVESLEVMNIVTYSGSETGSYPLTIYRPWFRMIFIFVVPLACVTYFPALAILGRKGTIIGSPAWFHWAAPALGVVFLLVSLQVWKFGVRHYRSTGS